jgi:hypothetical protein
LSFAAAGTAACPGNSKPRDITQAKDSIAERNDRGVAEIAGSFWKKREAERAGSLITLSCSIADSAGGRS